MKRICIALDYNPSAEKVGKIGYEYAKALNAEIFLVHVISDAPYYSIDYSPFLGYTSPFNTGSVVLVKELMEGASNFLSDSATHLGGGKIKTAVLEGEAGVAILEYLDENKMDLLVIGTHSQSSLENVLLGNTAVKIVKHTKIPLLVVPTKVEQ
ncbi:UspA domain-containing protein [Cellulophaga algicola DSM 14237]|uniref:UspA domain-containing protein n=1 Tax=Cellulophaga algicola (strain DSM 14237 / IC166 / ACAM 630) TaxID=688270 RepID=E6XEH2_CELAD|nr:MULTISPECIES: universal stress protein [Cellulophaga]ADV50262.1 UspA domain-containing protein [Cellulophaga algicola DSM 14237]